MYVKMVKGDTLNKKLSGNKASEKENYTFYQAVLPSKE